MKENFLLVYNTLALSFVCQWNLCFWEKIPQPGLYHPHFCWYSSLLISDNNHPWVSAHSSMMLLARKFLNLSQLLPQIDLLLNYMVVDNHRNDPTLDSNYVSDISTVWDITQIKKMMFNLLEYQLVFVLFHFVLLQGSNSQPFA